MSFRRKPRHDDEDRDAIRRDKRGNLRSAQEYDDDEDDGRSAAEERKSKIQMQKEAAMAKRKSKSRFAGMIARKDNSTAGKIQTISIQSTTTQDFSQQPAQRTGFGGFRKKTQDDFDDEEEPARNRGKGHNRPARRNSYEDEETRGGGNRNRNHGHQQYDDEDDDIEEMFFESEEKEYKSNRGSGFKGVDSRDRPTSKQSNKSTRNSGFDREGRSEGRTEGGHFDPGASKIRRRPGQGLDLSDLQNFLTTCLPYGNTLQCKIVRNKKGLKGKMFPTYECYYGEVQDEKLLFCASKRTKNKTSNYTITCQKQSGNNTTKNSPSYLGKLRSNFMGTEFTLYDKGVNPKSASKDQPTISRATIRQELGFLMYESNVLGKRGPRKITIAVPEVDEDGHPYSIFNEPGTSEKSLTSIKSGSFNGMTCLVNKKPKWDERAKAFTLDFGGRVTKASIKNFQLCVESDDDANSPVVLQFGRCEKDEFAMDVTYPLSPIQAFAFCLASFDNKLGLE
mmetsp:Transcript_27239/g.53561  ORF Transcript_27239/g.53561 Transcript_27239/m.53561 type:complete len:507 (-) Transcript_27239:166-1686(-)|eukprot:CAMPEP_0175138152 /NCGR_PEP_ID=MMETSP0087-20121206/10191_1 /TAXON_ID=136419 /ORGANISM="Unknown Unknown, Strain D1" /LENGTH=506 /DNA_ID=CAMNT_0016421025 /DNA_START=26 /DNA_END=1546 /DNA_ORIENTATION=+